jgi:hypothetical protein
MVYLIPAVPFASAIIAAGVYSIVLGRFLTRYATLVRLTIMLVTASCLLPAAYYFLNGILDASPGIEIPSRVIDKGISAGEYGGPYIVLSVPWKGNLMQQTIEVSRQTLADTETGDTVRLVVHPGAFSQPWYGDILPADSGGGKSR